MSNDDAGVGSARSGAEPPQKTRSVLGRRAGKVVAGVLAAVIPGVLFLSDPPLWWNRAHLLWNEFAPHAPAVVPEVSPVPAGAVVVPLSASDAPPNLTIVDVYSSKVLRRLPAAGAGSGAGTPTLSADRRTVFFSDSSGNVRSADAEGNGGRILYRTDASCPFVRHVSVSEVDPGHLLLQCRDRPAENQTDYHDFFELIDLQGLLVKKFNTTSSKVDDPTLSPDGRYLAYWGSSDTDISGYPGGGIYVLDLTMNQEPTQITPATSARDADPAWSPDSETLAFSRREDDEKSIYSVELFKSDPQRILRNAQKPTWSTDGGSLVAIRKRSDDRVELIRFDKEGDHVKAFTKPQKTIWAPVWSGR